MKGEQATSKKIGKMIAAFGVERTKAILKARAEEVTELYEKLDTPVTPYAIALCGRIIDSLRAMGITDHDEILEGLDRAIALLPPRSSRR